MKRGPVVAILVLGLGLVAAPAVFQMFTRAPKGGRMISDFRPYMTHANVAKFQRYMAEIDRADRETTSRLPQLLSARAGVSPSAIPARFASLADFNRQWPAIHADMSGDMLVTMNKMVPNYRAVAALPPFPLFPWFFVLPGLFVAVLAALALRTARRGGTTRRPLNGLVVLGVAIIAAPAVFQMFTRAPQGAQMITSFKPLMTSAKVARVQGYFLVIGAAEGQLRNEVTPLLIQGGLTPSELAAQLPALDSFHRDWPRISADMAPMIGAMSDNVGNFAAVVALPPFWLFPWFFVIPGLLIAALALVARSSTAKEGTDPVPLIGRTSAAAGRDR